MPETAPRSLGPTGWAVYLGCSWTWCIGMFLPALLIRDLGLWGYVVFAVPNVLGAAAMGWVLKSPESSRRLVEDHKHAAVLFSQVTLLFHLYWFAWLGKWTLDHTDWPVWVWFLLLALPIAAQLILRKIQDPKKSQIYAMGTWLISASLLLTLAFTDSIKPTASETLQRVPFSMDVVWLLPASVFGFAFCPYLDLTFHHARHSCKTRQQSRIAFGLGFGVFFFSMIVLTVLYAGAIGVLTTPGTDVIPYIVTWVGVLLALHIGYQLLFTWSVHAAQLETHQQVKKGPYGWFHAIALCVALLGLAIMGKSPELLAGPAKYLQMTWGEIIYRAFLTFYGLIFPTYVYLNIWNIRGRCLRTRTPRSLRVTLVAIAIASPFFFMGFFVRDERYIPAGVAILLLAKLFTGSDARPAPLTQPA